MVTPAGGARLRRAAGPRRDRRGGSRRVRRRRGGDALRADGRVRRAPGGRTGGDRRRSDRGRALRLRHAASARFGRLLILTGFGWFLATLSESPDPWLYSIGRVAGWTVEVALVYLILAFPTGRLPARVDRVLVGLIAAVVLCLYVPTAVLVEHYPLPEPVDGLRRAAARRTRSCSSRTSPRGRGS